MKSILDHFDAIVVFICAFCVRGILCITVVIGTWYLFVKYLDKWIITPAIYHTQVYQDLVFYFRNKEEIRSMRLECEEEERKAWQQEQDELNMFED